MALDLTILYRGPLSSCNYDCHYCPFAKHHETAAELRVDRQALERFAGWCVEHDDIRLQVFFTPWGEALTRRWYRETITSLSRQRHVQKIAIQTNLSCDTDWLAQCELERVGLWCTWHPDQTSLERFVGQCARLDELGVRYSVGVVGLREHWEATQSLRQALSNRVYLWVNAYKDEPNYYDDRQIEQWRSVDPLFETNLRSHRSLGRPCRTGNTVVSVDGEGTVRRCHFIRDPIGNLYDDSFLESLRPRDCTNDRCGCHIGYVHLEELRLDRVYGDGLLERIPIDPVWQ